MSTIAEVVEVLHGEDPETGLTLSYQTPAHKLEAACTKIVSLATPFNHVQLGVLEAQLLLDPWDCFSRRGLQAMVRGIMQSIAEYQKAVRKAVRSQAHQKH